MKFREFTINNHSTRDFGDGKLERRDINDIENTLEEINSTIGKEKGFSFILMKYGEIISRELKNFGGYCGLMVKSPHYIGLYIDKTDPEIEFLGAFHMQAIIHKLYEMNIGSCWVTLSNITPVLKLELIGNRPGTIQYLLAFGKAQQNEKKNDKHEAVINRTSKYEQDPYGITLIKTDDTRLSVVDTVYLNEWGNPATFSEMKSHGVLDLLYYVRNSPSYENGHPCRLILKNGYMELANMLPYPNINFVKEKNYTDAGVMMYMLQGLARELGFLFKWHYISDDSPNMKYRIVARIDL